MFLGNALEHIVRAGGGEMDMPYNPWDAPSSDSTYNGYEYSEDDIIESDGCNMKDEDEPVDSNTITSRIRESFEQR